MRTEIYIVRHGEAEGNLYRNAQGHSNGQLTITGRRQLELVRDRFADVRIDAAYSSDLDRAYETGVAVCGPKGLEVVKDARFKEICLGIWENMPWGEILRDYGEDYRRFMETPLLWQTEGCESFVAAGQRFVEGLTERAEAHRGGCIAIFTHGCVIRAALTELLAREPALAETPTGHSDNTAVSHLFLEEDGHITLDYLNDNSHLGSASTFVRHLPKLGPNQLLLNFCYRPFGEEDVKTYAECRREAWKLLYGSERGCEARGFARDALHTARAHAGSVLVAEYEGRFGGLLQLNPNMGAAKGDCHISFLYVVPELRNRSLGVQLLGRAVRWARDHGRTHLTLRVAQVNEHARGFYEYYGFEPVATEPCSSGGDLIFMRKTI